MRAAIYARMSTDKQGDTSPADQVTQCREYAEREGWQVVPDLVIEDAGISGASRHNRPRLLELVARIDEWDVLLCFDWSRLARNQEDLGWIANRLRAHRRRAIEVSTGLDLENVGAKVMGVLNEEYLSKLRHDTRRGLRGRVERGFAAGAVPYGYQTEKGGQGSQIVIVPEQAEIVVRIFALYADGDGIKAIAHRLNAESVPPPRPRAQGRAAWSPTAIREMLRNTLYHGELVWGRSEWVKDHETGRRRRYERPESEWVRREDESWRIVPEDLWSQVQERIADRAGVMRSYAGKHRVPRREHNPRARRLLAGFLVCEECGGAFHDLDGRRGYGCSWRRNRGTSECGNALRVPVDDLERRILDAIRDQVLNQDAIAYVVAKTLEIVRERQERGRMQERRVRLAEVSRGIERLVDLAARVGDVDEIAAQLQDLQRQQSQLAAEIEAASAELSVAEITRAVERHLTDLRTLLQAGEAGQSRRVLRALFGDDRLRVGPDAERGFRVTGTAWLSLDLETEPARGAQASGPVTRMVAGAGFEPATSGL